MVSYEAFAKHQNANTIKRILINIGIETQ